MLEPEQQSLGQETVSHIVAGVAGRSTEHWRLRHAFVVTNLLKLEHQEDEHCQWE